MNHDNLCCNSCNSSLLCQRNPDGKKQEEQKRGRVNQIGLNIPDGVFSPSFVIQRIAVGDILRSIPAHPCK